MCQAQEWRPSLKLPKPVYIETRHYHDIMQFNTELRNYRNLTAHFTLPIVDGKYDTRSYRPEVFHKNYLNRKPAIKFDRDINDVTRQQLHTLDIEKHKLYAINNENWSRQTQEVEAISNLMKSTGRPVGVYGINYGPSFYQTYSNIYRHWYNKTDLKRAELYYQKIPQHRIVAEKLAERFDDVIDYNLIGLYVPEYISDVDSWKLKQFLFYFDKYLEYLREFSTKPNYIVLQPNYVGQNNWQPIQKEIWDKIVRHAFLHPDVDAILIFTLPEYRGKPVVQDKDWESIFLPKAAISLYPAKDKDDAIRIGQEYCELSNRLYRKVEKHKEDDIWILYSYKKP